MWKIKKEIKVAVEISARHCHLSKTDLEKFWKEMRKDFGLNEVQNQMVEEEFEDEETKDNIVMDSRNLNDAISKYLKNKP